MLFRPALLASSLLVGLASAAPQGFDTTTSVGNSSSNGSLAILIGSYTPNIFTLEFTPPSSPDANDGTLVQGHNLTTGPSGNPSWLARHPYLDSIIYATQDNIPNGSVIVGRLSEGGQKFEVLGDTSSAGSSPAHAVVTKDGAALLVGNYDTGSVVIVPLDSEGLFLNASLSSKETESSAFFHSFPYKYTTTPLHNIGRQERSHPHQLIEVGDNREFWVTDLGQDKIWKLRVVGSGSSLHWESLGALELTGSEGGGPRHALVSNDTRDLYVLEEMLPVLVHSLVPLASNLTNSTSNSTLPTKLISKTSIIPPPLPNLNVTSQNSLPSGAELLLLSTFPLKAIVASTRTLSDRPQDAIAIFDLKEDRTVELKQFAFPRKGRQFRGVGASKDGKWIVVTGQMDGWVSVFGKNSNGTWVEVVKDQVQLVNPVHVLFL